MSLTFPKRLLLLAGLAAFGMAIIVLGLIDLQIFDREQWVESLRDRGNLYERTEGVRGRILDARGEVLATDVPGFDLMVVTAGRDGILHECKVCQHQMHIRKEDDGKFNRCPRCRSTEYTRTNDDGEEVVESDVFARRDQRTLGPLAEAMGKHPTWLKKRLDNLKTRNALLVEEKLEDFQHLSPTRFKERRTILRRHFGWQELRVKRDVPYEAVREVTLNSRRNPGFRVRETRVRRNVGGGAFAHLIGTPPDHFVRAMNEATGMGLERTWDRVLSGEFGYVQRARDRDNPARFVVVDRKDPIPGVDVQLTIARRDQEAALRALNGRPGALVVVEAETGAVLVLASSPTYDPLQLGMVLKQDEANKENRRYFPRTINRAVRGWYPPGSTIKPFTAVTGLSLGVIDPSETIDCHRTFVLNGKSMGERMRCNGTHGPMNMRRSLVKSCNIYFQTVMHRVFTEHQEADFLATCGLFGLGQATGLSMEPRWVGRGTFKMHPHKGRSSYGARLQAGIGQGTTTATPAQIARAYAALYTGHLSKLHVVRRYGAERVPPERTPIGIPPPVLHQVRESLRANNAPGAHRSGERLLDWKLGWKTGTAQTATSRRDYTAWLAGFADAQHNRPAIAFAIVFERSPLHGGDACSGPLADFLAAFYGQGEQG